MIPKSTKSQSCVPLCQAMLGMKPVPNKIESILNNKHLIL